MSHPSATSSDFQFMQQALDLAAQARAAEEVPIGALVVYGNEVIATGFNQTLTATDPSAHAEIIALRGAAEHLKTPRLPGATLYVTVEPCVMCVGAIVQARIDRLVFGAREPNTGAVASAFDLLMSDRHNHRVLITEGVLADECAAILKTFFKGRR